MISKNGGIQTKRIAFMLLTLLLCACQPTPEYDAVKQKDTNKLIEAMQSDRAQNETPAPYEIPEHFVCDFITAAQNVHITADVPIEVLSETGSFPVLRVTHRRLTNEERLTLVKRFLHTDTPCLYTYQETREDLEAWIRIYMQEKTEEDKQAYPQYDLDRTYYDSSNPLAIINAVDGSVIDPWKGY